MVAVQNLTLEIGQRHIIIIDNADRSDAGCCKILDCRTSYAARANQQDMARQ